MESFVIIEIGMNNIDILVIGFVKSTVTSFNLQSQVGIKYIMNNVNISHIKYLYICN